MNKQPPCLDFLNNKINVGDTVAYPGRRGSSMWMVKSQVVSIESVSTTWGKDEWILKVQHPTGVVRTMTNIQRVIVVTSLENK